MPDQASTKCAAVGADQVSRHFQSHLLRQLDRVRKRVVGLVTSSGFRSGGSAQMGSNRMQRVSLCYRTSTPSNLPRKRLHLDEENPRDLGKLFRQPVCYSCQNSQFGSTEFFDRNGVERALFKSATSRERVGNVRHCSQANKSVPHRISLSRWESRSFQRSERGQQA